MAETERRQRVITSTPRLSPEEVANRTFGSSFRGYAENEVRTYLRRVSEELAASHEREQHLVDAVDDLEEQLRVPKPLDEQELLDALGEETARLLRSARDAADDIRRKAEERSSSVMEEAQTEAHRLRTDAAEILSVRSQEAEAAAAEIVSDAEARADEIRVNNERVVEEQRSRATQEAEAIVEDARRQGREMLEEARLARERVLSDLGRRRSLLQAQVEELRQGRDRLLEAYRVVKRTFLDATEALAQVEARAASERAQAAATHEHADVAPVLDSELATRGASPLGAPGDDIAANDEAAAGLAEDVDGAEAIAEIPGPAAPPSPDLSDVDSLFARIRAGQAPSEEGDQLAAPTAPGAEGDAEPESTAAEAAAPVEIDLAAAEAPEVAAAPEAPAAGGEEPPEPLPAAEAPAAGPADAWRGRHHAAVDPLLAPLVKRAKRAAQDDQNALLDAVRRHKGRPSSGQVLRADDFAFEAWGEVLRSALDDAYGAGREAAGAERAAAPDELLRNSAVAIASPLRERLVVAIDDLDAGDTSGLVERIGARYREWKNQQLERALGDVMVAAWSRGVYDGSADGTTLQWIPLAEGRCADCDDNALEPTVKGETFPTGQPHPPAHPGCRCLLAPVAALAGLTPQ
jgi:DivIVA domain-containing protein